MRRLTVILLSLIYISTTSGIVINTHYCMGEITEIALGTSNDASCSTCGMENEGCCHDDLQVFKLNEQHNYAAVHFEMPALPSLVPTHSEPNVGYLPIEKQITGLTNHSPPLVVPRNILFCVYRI